MTRIPPAAIELFAKANGTAFYDAFLAWLRAAREDAFKRLGNAPDDRETHRVSGEVRVLTGILEELDGAPARYSAQAKRGEGQGISPPPSPYP